jgi:hypothetical protein
VGCLVAGMIGGLISVGRGWVRGRRCAVIQGVPVPVEVISHCVWESGTNWGRHGCGPG